MFNNKRRIASAWAKGLMLGKAVGAKDERNEVIEMLKKELTLCECENSLEHALAKLGVKND